VGAHGWASGGPKIHHRKGDHAALAKSKTRQFRLRADGQEFEAVVLGADASTLTLQRPQDLGSFNVTLDFVESEGFAILDVAVKKDDKAEAMVRDAPSTLADAFLRFLEQNGVTKRETGDLAIVEAAHETTKAEEFSKNQRA